MTALQYKKGLLVCERGKAYIAPFSDILQEFF